MAAASVASRRTLTWLFDLDNTLHDAQPHIFPHLHKSMTEYIMRYLALDEPDAGALRERYWRSYGATLLGLMRHHDVDPHHFLWHTHQLPDMPRMIVAEAGLRHGLKRLHGRKILFSNSPRHYAQAVLDVLGIGTLFDAVCTIERTRFQPKPSPAGFRMLIKQEGLLPQRTVMVEDSLENLVVAHKLGMKTVWITRDARRPRWLDIKAVSVLDLPRRVGAAGISC